MSSFSLQGIQVDEQVGCTSIDRVKPAGDWQGRQGRQGGEGHAEQYKPVHGRDEIHDEHQIFRGDLVLIRNEFKKGLDLKEMISDFFGSLVAVDLRGLG